jgi:predicted aspartyl protease
VIEILVAAAAIVLPLRFEDGNVLVDASVDGKPVHLIVDSGGKGSLQLTAAAAARVGVKTDSTIVSRTDALGNSYAGPGFPVAELEIAGTKFLNLPGFVRGEAASGVTGPLPADGMLGMEFLRDYVARFDYASKSLTLFSADDGAEAGRACSGSPVPVFSHPLRLWLTAIQTDHGVFRAILDTGATYSMISSATVAAAKLPLEDDLYRTVRLDLGTREAGPLDFVSFDLNLPGADALLGYNFFERHVVCFDGPRHVVTIVS